MEDTKDKLEHLAVIDECYLK